ncbi:B12-binding domain-containing radical SAM protein [Spirochaetota bacterium]
MKVLLIQPGIDNKWGKIVTSGFKFRPITPLLAMPSIAALTPPEVDVKIIDEVHGLIEKFEEADLVGITGMTLHANRMYKIADHYRSMGTPVVLGGVHVSFMADEASQHADSIVIGEAENTWPQLIKDFQNGQLKPVYNSSEHLDLQGLPFPRLDLVDGSIYQPPRGTLNSIMATRGCPHNCTFCCVTKMYGKKFRTRPIPEVISEIEAMENDNTIFFTDDNLIGNPKYAKELLKALIPLKKKWFAQLSIKIAEDEELLELARESGGEYVYIGFESISADNIESVNKKMVNKVEKYEEYIKIIHDYGFKIIGSFIIGLDNDDENSFDELYDFIARNKILIPLTSLYTPFPGTEAYKMFKKENRIIVDDWDRYNFHYVVFQPKKMTPEQLQSHYDKLLKRINTYTVNMFRQLAESMRK